MKPCGTCNGIAAGRYKLDVLTPYGRKETHIVDLCGTCGLTVTQHRRTKVVDAPVGSNRPPQYIAYYDVTHATIIRLYATMTPPAPPPEPLKKSPTFGVSHPRKAPNARIVTRFRNPLNLTFINDPLPEE